LFYFAPLHTFKGASMLYQLHFDNYYVLHQVGFVIQDLIYKFKVKGELLEMSKNLDDKLGFLWEKIDHWHKEKPIDQTLTLTEQEALFLSEWLQANSTYYPNLAALQGTLQPLEAAA
jgi:hypothetical protein